MKQNLYWKKFAESGSIIDYLDYKKRQKQTEQKQRMEQQKRK